VGPWVFAEILRDVNGSAPDWQAIIRHGEQRDVIELHLETDSHARADELEAIVLRHLRDRFPDFWKNHEMKLYDLRLTTSPPGTLRNGRKLRRVVDQRQMQASPRKNS